MMIKMNINKLEKMLKNNGAPKEAILFAEQNLGKAQYTAFAELFDQYLNSCTGVASKKKSPLIKINPICKELITIDKDFNDSFINIDYKSFEGEELNTEKTSKMDKWLIAMGGNNSENKEIYKDYQEALFERRPNLSKEDAMNFYTVKKPSKDQLRALYVYVDYGYSIALGFSLDYYAQLLRVD